MDILENVLTAMYGPRKLVVMHESRVEACRAQFEEEFPRHELVGSSDVPFDMVYIMLADSPLVETVLG